MKVVINTCYGGFSLSAKGMARYAELKGVPCFFFKNPKKLDGTTDYGRYVPVSAEKVEDEFCWFAFNVPEIKSADPDFLNEHMLSDYDIKRNDPLLVQVVEELGGGHRTGASGKCAKLSIVEIPDGIEYEIEEYDGNEHVAEAHRTWR